MLATVLLITHVKKQRNWMCQTFDKCLQITTSPFSKITETAPFPPRRLSNTSIAVHSNSIAGYVIIRKQTYCEHDYGSRYWIWMNSYWNVRKSVRWKGSSFCDFEIGLVVIWRHLSNFWHIQFLCFLTWVMRRTVANINPKISHFDEVDFSGHHLYNKTLRSLTSHPFWTIYHLHTINVPLPKSQSPKFNQNYQGEPFLQL